MREIEDGRSLSTLPVELKVHLGFKEDTQRKEWLIHDEIAGIGGADLYESLPARARVSSDGTRYEIGVREEDVDGLLALARIINPQAQGLDQVKSFWKNHPKFSIKEEAGWMYIGANIEPTPIDFETEFGPVQQAYDLAITAAIKNMTYGKMKAHDWHGDWMNYAENPNQRTLLFSTLEHITRSKQANHEINPKNIITANNLREFPLSIHKVTIHFAPGKLVWDGKQKNLDNIYVYADNGKPEVNISNTDSRYNNATKQWEHDDIKVKLPIPKELDIKTVDDLKKLKSMQILNDEWEVVGEMDIEVKVEDNAFRIISSDGKFNLEVRTPACEDCKIPTWKFPWPQNSCEDFDEKREKFSMHSVNTSLGIYRCLVNNNGVEKTFCFDCVGKLEDRYVREHPFVLRQRAIEVVRRRLDEMGNADVEIWEDQVWRKDSYGIKGWEFFTKIEYERDGRTIIRHTGIPTLSDEGVFTPNMLPRKYVEFRYR